MNTQRKLNLTTNQLMILLLIEKFQSYEVTNANMPNKYELGICLEWEHIVSDLEAFGYTNDLSVLDRIMDLRDHLEEEEEEELIIPPIRIMHYSDVMTF